MSSYPPFGESGPKQGGYPPPEGGQGQPPAGDDPLVPVSFGDWWAKVFGVVTRSWPTLLIIQVATVVPGLVIGALIGVTAGAGAESGAAAILGFVLSGIVIIVLSVLAQGASVFVAVHEATGRPVRAGEALSFAAGRALPLLGWGFLAGIMTLIGFFLLVLPGLYLLIVFSAALTGVIMFEHRGIGRAVELANKRFWPTAGRLVTFVIAAAIYSSLIEVVVGSFLDSAGLAHSLVVNVLTVPVTLATVGVAVVAYAELRSHENRGITSHVLAQELRA